MLHPYYTQQWMGVLDFYNPNYLWNGALGNQWPPTEMGVEMNEKGV